PGIELVHEALDPLWPASLQHLDHQLAASGHVADEARPHAALLSRLDPGFARMAPPGRVAPHIGGAPETGDPVGHCGGTVAVPVDLERGAHEGICGVVSGGLGEGPV